MTLLHALFHTKNLQGFQRLLDGANDRKHNAGSSGAPGTSGGYRPSPLASMTPTVDVNARDWLGRTVLHLAVTSEDYFDYFRALLKLPNLNVNITDTESQWTPLHRALYHANIPAARLLLQRSDIDTNLKDKEGYTAFDVYNSTVPGTKPDVGDKDAELFTWGANRNAALGLGDGNDRATPDRVVISPKEELEPILPLLQRFSPIRIRDVEMSKLHTGVITSESAGNLRVCGFGSGGRLGRGQQMQYDLNPLPEFEYTIVAVALGQDHTLAVTKNGEVLSWGLNRFSQLGYVVETTSGKFDEPIQATPKKILNPLRKEVVIGVAACKTASACWTEDDVYTWGTNHGQLGYDKQAHPVQILPRKVTKFSQPIVAMSMTDNVIACLLRTQQVECIWNDRHYRVNFPVNAFPSEIQPYRPPQAIKASHIAKITASDDLIAALSSNGEVFTFSAPTISADQNNDGNPAVRHPFQPQRIWALRKKFSSVQDVAIGADGSIIICTESGHVYTRIRNVKGGGKNFKFQRVPYLQRITQVSANSTGAFGALRVDFRPRSIPLEGHTLAQDLATLEPFRASGHASKKAEDAVPAVEEGDEEEEREDADLEQDIDTLRSLISAWKLERQRVKTSSPLVVPSGVDLTIHIGNLVFHAHRAIFASRSPPLLRLLDGASILDANHPAFSMERLPSKPGPGFGVTTISALKVSGINTLTLLILLHYLYSDEVLAIWDRRINVALAADRRGLTIDSGPVKSELQMLARVLELPALEVVLPAPVKRVPAATLPRDMIALFDAVQNASRPSVPGALAADVVLELADREVWTHSMILRCRSGFFEGMFGSEEWTARRWSEDGVLRVDFGHRKWHVMRFVLRFMVCGEDKEMFEVLPFVKSVDELLEFMFDVMGAATELLLDRLILICSSVVLNYLDIHNCCYILSEATYYHAVHLVSRVHEYMAANLESLLELSLLDDLPLYLLEQVSKFIAGKQADKSRFTRTSVYVDSLLAKYWDWLADQDIPEPIVRSAKSIAREGMRAARISPPAGAKERLGMTAIGKGMVVQPTTPRLKEKPSGDDIFAMDDMPSPSGKHRHGLGEAGAGAPVWKVADAPRVDMKALMAEAQSSAPHSLSGSPKYVVKKQPSAEGQVGPSTSSATPFAPTTPTKGTVPPPRNPNSPWRSVNQAKGVESGVNALSSSAFPSIGAAPQPSPRSPSVPSTATTPRGPAGPASGGLSMTRPPQPPASPLAHAQQGGKHASGSSSAAPTLPGLGPVITPTKQPSKVASNSIRVASGKAWTLPPPEPIKPATPSKGSASGVMSFAAIQQAEAQRSAQGTAGAKDKRSLMDIQREEAELQQEVEFMKWWTEEEERMRREMEALEAFGGQSGGGGGGGGRGQQGGHGRGRGRGGRQGQGQGRAETGSGQASGSGASGSGARRKGKGKGTGKEGSAVEEASGKKGRDGQSESASAVRGGGERVDGNTSSGGAKQGQARRQRKPQAQKARPAPSQQQ